MDDADIHPRSAFQLYVGVAERAATSELGSREVHARYARIRTSALKTCVICDAAQKNKNRTSGTVKK